LVEPIPVSSLAGVSLSPLWTVLLTVHDFRRPGSPVFSLEIKYEIP
jgi:hypothetical protein